MLPFWSSFLVPNLLFPLLLLTTTNNTAADRWRQSISTWRSNQLRRPKAIYSPSDNFIMSNRLGEVTPKLSECQCSNVILVGQSFTCHILICLLKDCLPAWKGLSCNWNYSCYISQSNSDTVYHQTWNVNLTSLFYNHELQPWRKTNRPSHSLSAFLPSLCIPTSDSLLLSLRSIPSPASLRPWILRSL